MSKEKALECFRKPPLGLNCAQAIAHAFGRDDLSDEMRGCGLGRAPDGLCGALFCAMKIAGPNKADAIAEKFERELGDRRCAELKRVRRVPCTDCISCAADILASAEI